ncbi:hypothetical protein [Haloarcula sp. H-GB5]|jgi:hypothetical protein
MVTKLQLALDTKDEVQHLSNTLSHLLGDKIYQRNAEQYNTDIDIPDSINSDKALGTPPARVSGSSLGSVLTFKGDVPFAMVHLWYDPEDGPAYSLGTHAGWDKVGDVDDVREYWKALDSILDQLGVLPEAYKICCPCGHTETVAAGHVPVKDAISTHYDGDHPEDRIRTTTLVEREVIPVDSTSGQLSQTTPITT